VADTLAYLRAEASGKLTRHEREALVLRTWKAALSSVRGREPVELVGCGDNSCVIVSPKGMATNGGCRCDERALRRAVLALKAQRAVYLATSAELGLEGDGG
jgi:hypothetical protein